MISADSANRILRYAIQKKYDKYIWRISGSSLESQTSMPYVLILAGYSRYNSTIPASQGPEITDVEI